LGAELIIRVAHRDSAQAEAGLTLLFPAGARPSAEAIERALATSGNSNLPATRERRQGPDLSGHRQPVKKRMVSRISSLRGRAEGWVELLANGLTFDLTGLEPGPPLAQPDARHFFGLPRETDGLVFEAIALSPGPHLAGAGAMLPVVRTMACIASALALELDALAVCWEPAGSWMDCQYFSRVIDGWCAGGAFPALGLTGIERTHDGGVESDGLAFFVGQELRIEARRGESAADTVKLAARVIDHLVSNGAIFAREALVGPGGEPLLAEPSTDGKLLRVWRDG
jgi:hypothetical protein